MSLSAILTAYPRSGVYRLSIGRLLALSLIALLFPLFSFGQAPLSNAQPMGGGGNSTAGAHAAIHDSENRPITAGGFVNTGPVVFEDVTRKSGLDTWHHTMGAPDKKFIIETNGSGVGLIDYDNDGWLDIYLVNGSTVDALTGKATPPHAALFHNNHDGTFTDVAA